MNRTDCHAFVTLMLPRGQGCEDATRATRWAQIDRAVWQQAAEAAGDAAVCYVSHQGLRPRRWRCVLERESEKGGGARLKRYL